MRYWLFCAIIILWSAFTHSADQSPTQKYPALWEYGVGIGFVRYFHYPASNQSRDLALPFPTFQYRGEVLRADDRDGAKAYLLKSSRWTLDLGGGFLPALKSEDNEARKNMDPLLWSLHLGPQFIYDITKDLSLSLGVYQSAVSDFTFTKTNGYVYEQTFSYWFDTLFKSDRLQRHVPQTLKEKTSFYSKVSLKFISGSRDYLGTFFDVAEKDATPDRPRYQSEAGFLGVSLGYFQTFRYDDYNFYFGFADSHYDHSVNRKSPLHRADNNRGLFFGMTYKMGESDGRSIPEDSGEGFLQKVKHRIEHENHEN